MDADQKKDSAPGWVSNKDLQLELKALRSDVKVWILAAVALNQFLAAVEIPTAVTGAAIAGVILKFVIGIGFRG
jgi:hypothetical protein